MQSNSRCIRSTSDQPPLGWTLRDVVRVIDAPAGHVGEIAYLLHGSWRFYTPTKGLFAYVADEGAILQCGAVQP